MRLGSGCVAWVDFPDRSWLAARLLVLAGGSPRKHWQRYAYAPTVATATPRCGQSPAIVLPPVTVGVVRKRISPLFVRPDSEMQRSSTPDGPTHLRGWSNIDAVVLGVASPRLPLDGPANPPPEYPAACLGQARGESPTSPAVVLARGFQLGIGWVGIAGSGDSVRTFFLGALAVGIWPVPLWWESTRRAWTSRGGDGLRWRMVMISEKLAESIVGNRLRTALGSIGTVCRRFSDVLCDELIVGPQTPCRGLQGQLSASGRCRGVRRVPAVLSGRALAAPAQPHAYVLKHHRTKHDGSKSIDRQTRTAACSSCVVEHSVEASTTTPRGWVPIHHPTAFDAALVLACIGIFRGTVSSIHPGANGDSFPAMLGRDSAHRLRIEPAPKACNFLRSHTWSDEAGRSGGGGACPRSTAWRCTSRRKHSSLGKRQRRKGMHRFDAEKKLQEQA